MVALTAAHGVVRRPLDLSLYLVTDIEMCGEVGVQATVAAAVAAGVTLIQLRDPAATDDELVTVGRAMAAVLAPTGVPLIVNDRVHLVEAMGAQGAHVGQGDLGVAAARAQLGGDAYLGLSVQSLEHVEEAARHGTGVVDYLGVGPVWSTMSKTDAAPPMGLENLAAVVAASPCPCVAIGGITQNRVRPLRSRGVAGVAVISAVCGQPDVAAATRALRRAWNEAPPAAETPAARSTARKGHR